MSTNYVLNCYFVDVVQKSQLLRGVNAKLIDKPVPGCETEEIFSDSYWECAVRHLTSTFDHQIGTCKMGPDYDPESVVDDRLKVYGIESLRVVDASVIPAPVSAHTNAPTLMVAEKAADLIKEDYGV